MKTLIFCTSYFDTEELYQKRYQKWIDYYNQHPFTNDKHIYLIDDCSNLELIIDDVVKDPLSPYDFFGPCECCCGTSGLLGKGIGSSGRWPLVL